ncbi:uncharacterized protein LOC106723014 isoform X2 [Alligator sinensis]|uniref:Uncharacterized protein LOC106723014 isoform X2 n=1 Tax=Alligator sinensis TaxID=38654 RepID=A0A1U8DKG6_ALLSI|nr:uncharacterized protein LOC106723014 isoform X2 [Alligator sinensis]
MACGNIVSKKCLGLAPRGICLSWLEQLHSGGWCLHSPGHGQAALWALRDQVLSGQQSPGQHHIGAAWYESPALLSSALDLPLIKPPVFCNCLSALPKPTSLPPTVHGSGSPHSIIPGDQGAGSFPRWSIVLIGLGILVAVAGYLLCRREHLCWSHKKQSSVDGQTTHNPGDTQMLVTTNEHTLANGHLQTDQHSVTNGFLGGGDGA